MASINCKGTLIDLSVPKVMGILNVTPDSFYDGGKYTDEAAFLNQVERMLEDGAHFIDVGAYSSRPGADPVSEAEELTRLLPVVGLLNSNFPEALISVDTFRAEVARQAVEAGASLINDISAGMLDEAMLETVARMQVPYIMMHMRGTPQTMNDLNHYEDLMGEVLYYFSERVARAQSMGIHDIIIDPGFGFAKNSSQNFKLLQESEMLQILELPVLIGVSRKSMIYKSLEQTPTQALNGTTVLNTIALQKGASILRVHDVKEAVECIKLLQLLEQG